MAITVIGGPAAVATPESAAAPVVELRPNWSTQIWYADPTSKFLSATFPSSQSVGEMKFSREYGTVKFVHYGNPAAVSPVPIDGWWVRLRAAWDAGIETAWQGRIFNDTREVHSKSPNSSGLQVFTAYGPLRVLSKMPVSRSVWWQDSALQTLDWAPGMNARDRRSMIVGNRTDTKPTDGLSHVFGGTSLWTRYEFLEYILARFANADGAAGPTWTIGGQFDALVDITDTLEFRTSETLADLIRQIVPLSMGLDYVPVPTDAGFEIHIYALQSTSPSFAGVTLPLNPNVEVVDAPNEPNLRLARVVTSSDQKVGLIRLLGKRTVVCCSLSFLDGTLEDKWQTGTSDSLEADYLLGTGDATDEPAAHDAARKGDRFRQVYRMFGAPVDWDFNSNLAAPAMTNDGGIIQASNGNWQNQVRSTLKWIPLREGFDYSTDPPVNRNAAGVEADFLPPAAWIYNPETGRFVLADEVGLTVSVSRTDWGVFVSGNPNHLIASNVFDSTDAGTNETATDPAFDYSTLRATIALETDSRLKMEYAVPGRTEHDGVIEIEVPNAEFWVLAPDTIVGVDANGNFVTSGGQARVLRNDAPRISLLMAGAIARYIDERVRAELVFEGLRPWGSMIGRILGVIEDGGASHRVDAPITSVAWQADGKKISTTVRTGFAR